MSKTRIVPAIGIDAPDRDSPDGKWPGASGFFRASPGLASAAAKTAAALAIAWGHASGATSENHPYSKVVIGYASDGCSFQYSPIDYCDAAHLTAIRQAVATRKPDFDRRYIVLPITERAQYFQRSVVAIDTSSGEVYPLPIDFYSGNAKGHSRASAFGKLEYAFDSDRLCIEGSIYAAHEQHDGRFCFQLEGNRFEGPRTPYTDG